jgi:hypothetical protein
MVHHPANGTTKVMVEIDKKFSQSERDWHRRQASMARRLLTMRTDEPCDHLLEDSATAITYIDPHWRDGQISQEDVINTQYCYQIALYLSQYLNAINFNTDAPEIRSAILTLQTKLSSMELKSLSAFCPRTLFNLLFYGAMGSRCQPGRASFIQLLASHFPKTVSMGQVFDMLNEFVDASSITACVVEEIWDEVLMHRAATSSFTFEDIQRDDRDESDTATTTPSEAAIPLFELPNLTRPLEAFEAHSPGAFPEFHLD